jgi:hypothetical protein
MEGDEICCNNNENQTSVCHPFFVEGIEVIGKNSIAKVKKSKKKPNDKKRKI